MADREQRAKVRDFLFEIGTEELPAAAARLASKQAGFLVREALENYLLDVEPENINVWVTPRRIAVLVRGLPEFQRIKEIAVRGPLADAAFDKDGKPTKAAEGFARAKKVKVEDLEIREYEGRQFVFAVYRKEGRPTAQLIPEICRHILLSFGFPKTMRWDGADLRFSRPVRWLVTKFGGETIEFEIAGIKSGDTSRGHRFLGGDVVIDEAGRYEELMAGAKVVVDQEKRRQKILEGLATEAGKQGASFTDPAGELEEVIYLVENPSVHAGIFAEEHLRLPPKVLITAMQSHQRYFPLTAEDGSLMAGFLYVMNGDPACAQEITEGNERVLEGRIEDAEFSFDKDLDSGIEAMVKRLQQVVFHRRLGTLADKTERICLLVEALADQLALGEEERKTAKAAARLAKADQVSVMVQEFPTLEGYIGSVYANMEGYPLDVCRAIEEHYLPTSAGGELPETVPGAVLAICDKVDNIMAAFLVDELPTGSRDPYGLRRAAIGLAEICKRFHFDFDLTVLLAAARQVFIDQKADIIKEASLVRAAFEFVCDRIQHRLVESGIPVEVVEAARAAGLNSILRIMVLTSAWVEFRNQPAFEDLHTAYFRCAKIAAKAGAEIDPEAIDDQLLQEKTERELFYFIEELEPQLRRLVDSKKYGEALALAATVRPVVDRFFDDVLVMSEDTKLRKNRLALVLKTATMLKTLGDPMRAAAAAMPDG